MMGISTEGKYLIKSLPEIRNMQQSDCLKCFLTKTGVLVAESADQKMTTQVYCCSTYWAVVDLALSAQYVCSQFLISDFSPSRLQFLLGNIYAIALLHISYFLVKI